jgi:hypothetical protein
MNAFRRVGEDALVRWYRQCRYCRLGVCPRAQGCHPHAVLGGFLLASGMSKLKDWRFASARPGEFRNYSKRIYQYGQEPFRYGKLLRRRNWRITENPAKSGSRVSTDSCLEPEKLTANKATTRMCCRPTTPATATETNLLPETPLHRALAGENGWTHLEEFRICDKDGRVFHNLLEFREVERGYLVC